MNIQSWIVWDLSLKIKLFLSFQKFQQIATTTMFRRVRVSYFPLIQAQTLHFYDISACSSNKVPLLYHTKMEYGHVSSKWLASSELHLQRAQRLGPSQPFLCKLFHVRIAFLVVNHRMTRILDGQLVFRRSFPHAILCPPSAKCRYAEHRMYILTINLKA